MKKRHKRVWNTYIFLTHQQMSRDRNELTDEEKQKQNQLQKRSQNAQKQEDFAAVATELGTGCKTAFDAKSHPDAALIEAANALAARRCDRCNRV